LACGWLTASAWPHLPSRRRVPGRVQPEWQPPAEFGPAAAARWPLSSVSALQPAALFHPKAAGRRRARPQLLFPAELVQVPSAAKLHTHFSCLGTCGSEQGINRRVWVRPAICQGKRRLRVQEWLPKHAIGTRRRQSGCPGSRRRSPTD